MSKPISFKSGSAYVDGKIVVGNRLDELLRGELSADIQNWTRVQVQAEFPYGHPDHHSLALARVGWGLMHAGDQGDDGEHARKWLFEWGVSADGKRLPVDQANLGLKQRRLEAAKLLKLEASNFAAPVSLDPEDAMQTQPSVSLRRNYSQMSGGEASAEENRPKKKKTRAETPQYRNFLMCLDIIMKVLIGALNTMGVAGPAVWIEQNLATIFRVLMIAEQDKPRKSRDKKQGELVTVTINLVAIDGQTASGTVNLDDLQRAFRASWPEKSAFELNPGSRMTTQGLMYSAIAVINRGLQCMDKLFAPGRSRVTKAGFPPATTTLTNGGSTPARFSAHNRWSSGVMADIRALISVHKSKAERDEKLLFDVVKKNLSERMTNKHLAAAVLSLRSGMAESKLVEALKTISMFCLALPAKEARIFLPPLSTMAKAMADNYDIKEMRFDINARDALKMMNRYNPTYATNKDTSMANLRLVALTQVLGTVFVSTTVVTAYDPEASTARSQIESRTLRVKIQTETMQIQTVNCKYVRYEVKPEGTAGPQTSSWQLNATGTFGTTAFSMRQLYAEATGEGDGSGTGLSTSRILRLVAKDVQKAEQIPTTMFARMDGTDPKGVEIVPAGIFSVNMDDKGVGASEQLYSNITGEDDDGDRYGVLGGNDDLFS